MNERPDRTLLTGAAIGTGAVGLWCALPVIATLAAVTLGLVFGLCGAVVAVAVTLAFFIRRRDTARNDRTRTNLSRGSP